MPTSEVVELSVSVFLNSLIFFLKSELTKLVTKNNQNCRKMWLTNMALWSHATLITIDGEHSK